MIAECRIPDKINSFMQIYTEETMTTQMIYTGTGTIFFISREVIIDKTGYSKKAICLGIADENTPENITKSYFTNIDQLRNVINVAEDMEHFLYDQPLTTGKKND